MKDDAKRIASYIAKTTPTTVGLKVAARLSGMKSQFGTTVGTFVDNDVATQGILNDAGIKSIQFPKYYAFTREMGHLVHTGITGAALLAGAVVLHAEYVTGYELADATIKKIALDVFSVTIP